MNLSGVIILCGLAGFPVGYASGSYTNMGWTGWIIPGVLLTAAGIMSLAGPDRIASYLPLLNSDNSRSRFLGRILISIIYAGVLILIMIGLLFVCSVPDTSPQGVATQDERDLESAGVSQSMGLYNESLPLYDNSAIACFDRALKIKPDNNAAEEARKEALRERNRTG